MGERHCEDAGSILTGNVLLDAKRILVLAPHPDDETLGCGGTIAITAARGAEVHVAVVSDGGKLLPEDEARRIDTVVLRKDEAREACRVLGVKETSFFGYPDGDLKSHGDMIKADVSGLVERFRPEIVLSPSPFDHHEDHIAVSNVVAEVCAGRNDLRLAFFQVYGTLRFNSLVDIGSAVEKKENAILCYRNSLFGDPGLFVEAVRGTNRFWSFYSRTRGYYEAFFVVPPSYDRAAIIRWFTYGEKELTTEEIFFSKLRAVDELLFELKAKEALLKERNSEIAATKSAMEEKGKNMSLLASGLAAKTEELAAVTLRMEEANRVIENITGSIIWRIAKRFYRFRDWSLPTTSPQRRIYDSIMSLFRRK
jgi:LmbE family N-acetylglucosaminyl deacetylase